jgi:hypothetical protein
MQRYDCRPMWAAGSAGSIRTFPVLPDIKTLQVFADHDEKKAGEKTAAEVIVRWRAAGREAEAWMPQQMGDFNDLEIRHG